jgi:hypothetical protein
MFEDAALARAREAHHLRDHGLMGGALYLSGYVIECRLKALLGKMGKSFPRSGRAGHDLIALWERAGLRYDDLSGFRKQFIDYWSTDLRYSGDIPASDRPEDLLAGAHSLAGYVQRRIRNTKGSRRKRGAS